MACSSASRQAERDLIDIWRYVARRRPVVANEVLRRIDRQCRLLADNPRMGRERTDISPGLRSFVVDRWLVLYRVGAKVVVVSRVVDGSRDIRAVPLPRR